MIIEGIEFNMDWREGTSPRPALPQRAGLYCEVIWPVRGIRIGRSRDIRSRHDGHCSWMKSMKKGTGSRTARSGPLADHARDWGDIGLETFVLSTDPRLADKDLADECERRLHHWAETQTMWKNFNGEKWRPRNYGLSVTDEVAAARAWGVTLTYSKRWQA